MLFQTPDGVPIHPAENFSWNAEGDAFATLKQLGFAGDFIEGDWCSRHNGERMIALVSPTTQRVVRFYETENRMTRSPLGSYDRIDVVFSPTAAEHNCPTTTTITVRIQSHDNR